MPSGDNPNSKANLKKGNRFTKETASKAGRNGALKANETKRQRKTLREELLALLEQDDTQERWPTW